MQYIPCNSALLAQGTLFLTQKGTFLPKDLQKKGEILTNLNSQQNRVCSSLKYSSESKLFSGGQPRPRTTSATLIESFSTGSLNIGNNFHLGLKESLILVLPSLPAYVRLKLRRAAWASHRAVFGFGENILPPLAHSIVLGPFDA